jgi:hypothetical protein
VRHTTSALRLVKTALGSGVVRYELIVAAKKEKRVALRDIVDQAQKVAGRCQVCGGDVHERFVTKSTNLTRKMFGPNSESRYVRVSDGFACSTCGIRYAFVAPHNAAPNLEFDKKHVDDAESLTLALNLTLAASGIEFDQTSALYWFEWVRDGITSGPDPLPKSSVAYSVSENEVPRTLFIDVAEIFARHGFDWYHVGVGASERLLRILHQLFSEAGAGDVYIAPIGISNQKIIRLLELRSCVRAAK